MRTCFALKLDRPESYRSMPDTDRYIIDNLSYIVSKFDFSKPIMQAFFGWFVFSFVKVLKISKKGTNDKNQIVVGA